MHNIIFSTWGEGVFDNRSGTATEADRPALPDHFHSDQPLKAMIGWDGLVILDDDVSVVALCHNYMEALARQSCGKCSPCPRRHKGHDGVAGENLSGQGGRV